MKTGPVAVRTQEPVRLEAARQRREPAPERLRAGVSNDLVAVADENEGALPRRGEVEQCRVDLQRIDGEDADERCGLRDLPRGGVRGILERERAADGVTGDDHRQAGPVERSEPRDEACPQRGGRAPEGVVRRAGLVRREDHGAAPGHEVVEPGQVPVEGRGGRPAVDEHDDGARTRVPRDDQPDLARAVAVWPREAGGRADLRSGRDRGRRGRGRPRGDRCANGEGANQSSEAGCHAADSSFALPSMADVRVVLLGVANRAADAAHRVHRKVTWFPGQRERRCEASLSG